MAGLTGFAGAFPGGTTDVYTTPYPVRPGTRAFDLSGNEYIFCDFGTAVNPEQVVMISHDGNFTTALFAVGLSGPIGVVCGLSSTSDKGGWVQIGGYAYAMMTGGSSLATSSGRALVPTSVSTPATALLGCSTGTSVDTDVIHGMYLTCLSSTGTTSAETTVAGSSGPYHTGMRTKVWMDHPYILPAESTS
jgi:hypothetical protein